MTKFIKTSKFLCTIIACILTSMICKAQSIQHGIVMQYNGREVKTSLGGVEILAVNAGSTVSGERGDFLLKFKTLKAGDRIKVMRVEKNGYVLFNKEAVDQWHISRSDKPFSIVMCREEKYREIRNNYERISSASYARQLKVEENKLLAQKQQNKLTEHKYKEQLTQLHNEYETRLENLDNYIDRVARIDLSELTEKENAIRMLMQNGKVDEAVKAYDDMNLEAKFNKEIKTIGALDETIDKLNLSDTLNNQSAIQTYEAICRKNDMLYLVGGTENIKKIKESMREIAFANTAFSKAMIDYAFFLEKDNEYTEALNVSKIALSNAKDEIDQYMILLLIGEIETYLALFEEAEKTYQKAHELINNIYKNDTIQLCLYGQAVMEGMANMYLIQGKPKESEQIYTKLNELRQDLYADLGISYSMSDIISNINRIRNLISNSSFDMALDLAYKTKSDLEQLSQNAQKKFECESYLSLVYSYMASALYRNLKLPEASSYVNLSINMLKKICKFHFSEYAGALSEAYNLRGGIMRTTKKYQEAIGNYQKALDMTDSLNKTRPSTSVMNTRFMAQVYTNMGLSLLDSHKYQNAVNTLKQALVLYEKLGLESIACKAHYTNALMGIGTAYFYLGDNNNCIIFYPKGLKNAEAGYAIYPKIFANILTMGLYNYCRSVCVPTNDYTTAETFIKEAISIINKKEVEHYDYLENIYYMLAYLYQMQGKSKEANDIVDYGVKHFPQNTYFLDAQGELLMKKGKTNEAIAVWNKIIKIDPAWASNGSDFSKMINKLNK